ncbi:MAG: adenosine kinase [Acidimicrobiaceae bacterium]|nr:adenosine kinase [Acidimicrobiaceae bacterium]
MNLIDEPTADRLQRELVTGTVTATSGGSAANTVVGVAALGGTSALIANVADDPVGRLFTDDLRAAGVIFEPRPASGGPGSGRCVVFVHPDAERTMCTFLGAASNLGPADVNRDLVARGKVTYLEGYLWDLPDAMAALREAARDSRAAGGKVALSLSDSFCVERHRESFLELAEKEVDLLFANESEILLLFGVDSFDKAAAAAADLNLVAALTRGAQGSVVVAGSELVSVPAAPVEKVIDTTGAGDLYAAGFLYGFTHGEDLERCARLGTVAAGEVIGHFGARPQVSLRDLATRALGPLRD